MTSIPWGLTRMTDRLPIATSVGPQGLDAATQIAVYLDEGGRPIEMGAHGTSKTKGTASMSGGGDGQNPPAQKQDDTTTDYESD